MTAFFYKLSTKLLFAVSLLDIFKNLMLPSLNLLVLVAVLMLADLITGVLKARLKKEKITSEKLRHSVIKFMQYFGSIGLIVVLANQKPNSPNFILAMGWARDGITILIIYIECLSIFENLYELDKKTPFAIYVIQPVYWLLSWAVRKNPFQQAQDEKKRQEEQADKAREELEKP
jgi:phage-related holin